MGSIAPEPFYLHTFRHASTGRCLTAVLANRPLANYHRKDCQSDTGVSPACAVTQALEELKPLIESVHNVRSNPLIHYVRLPPITTLTTYTTFIS